MQASVLVLVYTHGLKAYLGTGPIQRIPETEERWRRCETGESRKVALESLNSDCIVNELCYNLDWVRTEEKQGIFVDCIWGNRKISVYLTSPSGVHVLH